MEYLRKHRLSETEARQLLGEAEELDRNDSERLAGWRIFYAECDFTDVSSEVRFFLELQAQRLHLVSETKGGEI